MTLEKEFVEVAILAKRSCRRVLMTVPSWKRFGTRDLRCRRLSNFRLAAELLLRAAKCVTEGAPTLLVDGGVENYNPSVDELVDSGVLKRMLARTEITFSTR